MPKDEFIRLRHKLDAAQKAFTFTQGRSRKDLDENEMLALALKFRGQIPGTPYLIQDLRKNPLG